MKKKIKTLLDSYGAGLYYYMPVPSGYGRTCIDYLGCVDGLFFGIEAKATTVKKPTERQLGIIDDIRAAGGVVFVINDDISLEAFGQWLRMVAAQ